MSRFIFLFLISTFLNSVPAFTAETPDCNFTSDFYQNTSNAIQKMELDSSLKGKAALKRFVDGLAAQMVSCLNIESISNEFSRTCDFSKLETDRIYLNTDIASWLLDDYRGNVRQHLTSSQIQRILGAEQFYLDFQGNTFENCFQKPYVQKIISSEDEFSNVASLAWLLSGQNATNDMGTFLPKNAISEKRLGYGRDADRIVTLSLNGICVIDDENDNLKVTSCSP